MRRIALGLAGAATLLCMAAASGVARAPSGDDAGERLLAGLRAATGLQVEANGRSTVALFPNPRVRVDGVSFSRPGEAPFAVAREIVGSLDLGSLLFGRMELNDLSLVEPHVALDRAPAGETFAHAGALGVAGAPSVRVTDGRFVWDGGMIDKVEGGLALPRDVGALAVSGYGRFAGKRVEATVQISDPRSFASGGRAPFRARVSGGGAKLMFDGEAVGGGAPRLEGLVSLRTDSVADTAGWLGARSTTGRPPAWGLSLAGHGTIDKTGVQISNAEVDLAGDHLLGAGRATRTADGRLSIEATLDADRIDLGAYLAELAPEIRSKESGWSAEAIDLASLQGWTLDLRVSADEVSLGSVTLGETAATVAVAGGGLDLSIGEAAAFGGVVGGRLSLEPLGAATKLRLQGAATDIAVEKAAGAFVKASPIEGLLTAETALDGSGASVAELVASLEGRASARLTDGALEGVGRSRTLALVGLRGRMEVTSAEARMRIARGIARADDIAIVGPAATFALAGSASLIDLDMKLAGSVRPAEQGWTLPVVVDGPVSKPRLSADLTGRKARGEAHRGSAEPVP